MKNTTQRTNSEAVIYLEIPRTNCVPIKLDILLEQRMKEFILNRRAKLKIGW